MPCIWSSLHFLWYLSCARRLLVDETLTSSVLGIKEGAKIQGLQAAITGATASLIAQAVTTPVLSLFLFHIISSRILPYAAVFYLQFAKGRMGKIILTFITSYLHLVLFPFITVILIYL